MEYNVLEASDLPSPKNLNELAVEGWRLVQIVQHKGKIFVYVERPLKIH